MPTTAYRATLDAYDGSPARSWCCGRYAWRDGIAEEARSTGPASTRSSSAIRFHRRGWFAGSTPTRAKLSREEPDAGNLHVRVCVQRRLACSAGGRPAGVRVRSPVVWIAGWRETKTLKPIDNISLGEMTSHRAVTTVNAKVASKVSSPEGRAPIRRAKAAWGSRNLTEAAASLRRGGSDSTVARTC